MNGTVLKKGNKKRRKTRKQSKKAGIFVLLLLLAMGAVFTYFHLIKSSLPGEGLSVPQWIQQELLSVNPYSRPGTPLKKINGIVIHYVGNPGTSAKNNRDYFESLASTGKTFASSHFIVGLEGEIIQCVPLTELAYCSNSRNEDTISIEVCHPDASGKFQQNTLENLERLTAWLCVSFGLRREDVIRHYDVTGKICPKYYVEHEDAWFSFLDGVETLISAQAF
jgi:N-acetylmuramoyl-L-alanine amidase